MNIVDQPKLKVVNGQRKKLEEEIFNLVLDSFNPESTLDHETIMLHIDRLKPKGKLSIVVNQGR